MLDRRPPAGLVGIPQPSGCWRPPHFWPLKPRSISHVCLGDRRPYHSSHHGVSRAVLVPPTGNRVLNQIPAGDSRESSREQAVLDDGALLLRRYLSRGLGDHNPLTDISRSQWQSRLPDPQKKKEKRKKKKKKWNRSRGGGGVEVGITHGR